MKPYQKLPKAVAVLDIATAYGEEIKALRKLHGWTQAQVARKLGMAETTYKRGEQGHHTPRVETFLRIAPLYCLLPEALFARVIARARARATP